MALAPLGFGTSAASQSGQDHKVTICHRTNAENNPYVEITLDKAAVFKRGHDTHDEGGVYQPGDKANGIRWGDIIPEFDYYASPQDQRDGKLSHYDGLNDTAEGLAILGNGCEVPTDEAPEPAGSLSGECLEDGSFVVSGSLEDDGAENAQFRLSLSDGTTIALEGTSFEETITAPVGTIVQLQVKVGDGSWTDLDDPVTVLECEQPQSFGKIKVKKTVEGDPIGTSTDFTARVDCPGTAYDQDLPLNGGNGWTNTTDWIPTGTTCTVSEVNVPDGWDPEPDQPVEVTVGSGEPTEVSTVIRNVRRTGRVEIVKVLEGDPAGAATDFTVQLDCEGSDYDETAVLGAANNWTVTYRGIPSGISCTVTETDVPDGWELKSITPGTFEIDSFSTIKVEVTNERVTVPAETGSVEVRKATVGDPAGATTDFAVQLDCDGTAFDRTLPLTAANAWTARVDGIPAGTQCKVTEPTVPAGWTLTSISPAGSFTVQGSTVAKVTVTNARSTGVISVTKVLDGAASGASTTFTFDVDCPGTSYDQAVVVNVASGTSATGTTTQIPTGLTCTVTERSTPGWTQTSVVPANGAVAVGSTVTFTNRREQVAPGQRGLTVTKAVAPTGSVEFGATLTYSLTVTATGNLPQTNVVVTDPVPAGTTYTAGSATCDSAGPCSPSFANGVVTWGLGSMAAGTSRTVTFKVTVDRPQADAAGAIPAVTIVNAGAVSSAEVPVTPSNRVETPVTAVQPVKVGPGQPGQPGGGAPEEEVPAAPTQGGALPVTGSSIPAPWLAGMAGILVLMGLALMAVARPTPRRDG